MKFTCERCGKKYATAEDPAPGRVYKLKCKACGHLIVVRASQGAPSAAPPAMEPRPEEAAPALQPALDPAPAPEIQFEIGSPEPAQAVLDAPPASPVAPPPFDATTEVSVAALEAPALESAPREGYVDLFGEAAAGAAPGHATPEEDPFLAAARASLPENYGAGNSAAPDPFGPLREEFSESAPAQEPAPYRSTTKVPVIPKPAQHKSALPLVLIGGGVVVLVGILAFVLLSGRRADPPPPRAAAAASPPPAVAATQETPPPAPPPTPPAAEQAAAAPPPAPVVATTPPKQDEGARRAAAEERRRREREEAREREAQARAEREARDREAREARERERLERERRAREEREARERARREAEQREAERVAAANIPTAEAGLSQAQIEKVLLSTKKAFDGCIQQAKAGDAKLDGRRVVLRLNIQTSGAVTYPTLDDVTLNSTDLGSCLKSAARLMVFPKFKGDTMHIEVPLVLR